MRFNVLFIVCKPLCPFLRLVCYTALHLLFMISNAYYILLHEYYEDPKIKHNLVPIQPVFSPVCPDAIHRVRLKNLVSAPFLGPIRLRTSTF